MGEKTSNHVGNHLHHNEINLCITIYNWKCHNLPGKLQSDLYFLWININLFTLMTFRIWMIQVLKVSQKFVDFFLSRTTELNLIITQVFKIKSTDQKYVEKQDSKIFLFSLSLNNTKKFYVFSSCCHCCPKVFSCQK